MPKALDRHKLYYVTMDNDGSRWTVPVVAASFDDARRTAQRTCPPYCKVVGMELESEHIVISEEVVE